MPSEPDSFAVIRKQRMNIKRKRNLFGKLVFNKFCLLTLLPSLLFTIPLVYYELKFRRICSSLNQYQIKFKRKSKKNIFDN